MMRNVEIKARVSDFEAIRSVAEGIADGPPMLIEQEDTFFECPNGRLKVRRLSSHVGELIYYERRNTAEPAESRQDTAPAERPATRPRTAEQRLRDVFADVFREHLVDQRLVADVSTARFLAKRLKDARINADRDQSPWFVTERRPPHPPHRL